MRSYKPFAYRLLQAAAWIFAVLVCVGLAVMVLDFASGNEAPYSKLTIQTVIANVFLWAIPAITTLWLLHRPKLKNWFIN